MPRSITQLFALILVFLAGCGASDQVFVFRWAGAQPEQHPRSQSMIFFEKELEKRSNGRIQVENYFSGVLGREREVMDLISAGDSMKQIAVKLGISIQTCSKHRARVLEKMQVTNNVELVRLLLAAESH